MGSRVHDRLDGLTSAMVLGALHAAALLLSEPGGVCCCQHGDYGCPQSDVDDSYPGAKADIERLRTEQRLYAIHNHDLREFVLYPRCRRNLGRVVVSSCSEQGCHEGPWHPT